MAITIREAEAADAGSVSRLILGLTPFFLSDPRGEAAQAFLATVTPQAVAARIGAPEFRCHVAEDGTGVCGFVALRDGSHLYHLFVAAGHHGRGIGRALWQHARAQSASPAFTVNSSLFAVPVYERLGFVATDGPQAKDGLEFVPMAYVHGA